jgi:hypothetical protein
MTGVGAPTITVLLTACDEAAPLTLKHGAAPTTQVPSTGKSQRQPTSD